MPILLAGLVGTAMLRGGVRLLVWGTLLLYLALCWVDRFGNWNQVIMPAYALLLLGLLPCVSMSRRAWHSCRHCVLWG